LADSYFRLFDELYDTYNNKDTRILLAPCWAHGASEAFLRRVRAEADERGGVMVVLSLRMGSELGAHCQFAPVHLQPRKRPLLVGTHEVASRPRVGRHDRSVKLMLPSNSATQAGRWWPGRVSCRIRTMRGKDANRQTPALGAVIQKLQGQSV
jgi:hypothetical protein